MEPRSACRFILVGRPEDFPFAAKWAARQDLSLREWAWIEVPLWPGSYVIFERTSAGRLAELEVAAEPTALRRWAPGDRRPEA